MIGEIGLHKSIPDTSLGNLKQREIGYVLNPEYWGREYVPEAVKSLISYGFNEIDLDLIWCWHFHFNDRSKRVNEKCGFKYKFKRDVKLKVLDDKDVTTLYYNISKKEYDLQALLDYG